MGFFRRAFNKKVFGKRIGGILNVKDYLSRGSKSKKKQKKEPRWKVNQKRVESERRNRETAFGNQSKERNRILTQERNAFAEEKTHFQQKQRVLESFGIGTHTHEVVMSVFGMAKRAMESQKNKSVQNTISEINVKIYQTLEQEVARGNLTTEEFAKVRVFVMGEFVKAPSIKHFKEKWHDWTKITDGWKNHPNPKIKAEAEAVFKLLKAGESPIDVVQRLTEEEMG